MGTDIITKTEIIFPSVTMFLSKTSMPSASLPKVSGNTYHATYTLPFRLSPCSIRHTI